MIRIAIVVSFAAMAELAQQVFQEHTQHMLEQFGDAAPYSLEILVRLPQSKCWPTRQTAT